MKSQNWEEVAEQAADKTMLQLSLKTSSGAHWGIHHEVGGRGGEGPSKSPGEHIPLPQRRGPGGPQNCTIHYNQNTVKSKIENAFVRIQEHISGVRMIAEIQDCFLIVVLLLEVFSPPQDLIFFLPVVFDSIPNSPPPPPSKT